MSCWKCEEYKWVDQQEVVYTDPEDGKEYCLFHAPAEHKGMSVDDFNAQVSERIQATIELEDEKAPCTLDGTIFPGDICFEPECTLPPISFAGATLSGVDFRSAQFGGMASFAAVEFDGYSFFFWPQFDSFVDFTAAKFEGQGAIFIDSKFSDGVSFANVEFSSEIEFYEDEFAAEVDFTGAAFNGGVSFHSVQFEGNANFTGVAFGRKGGFTSVDFNRGATFTSFIAHENAVQEFANCTSSSAPIIFNKCDPTCLDLTQQYDLTNFRFIDSPWAKNGGRIKSSTEDDKLQLTRDFYQRMKAKYKAENNEYEASRWHIAEKEAQLKLLRQNGESKLLCFALWLYKMVSGFGENPVRGFWVLLGVLALPLLVLTGVEVWRHFAWWDFDLAKANYVFKEWLKFIPLTRAIETGEPGMLYALMIFWQLLITVQAALFAFALRNRFRR